VPGIPTWQNAQSDSEARPCSSNAALRLSASEVSFRADEDRNSFSRPYCKEDVSQGYKSLLRDTDRVDVGKTHDGTVCGTTENGRKHKVGETTQSQESAKRVSSSPGMQGPTYGADWTFLGYFFKKSAEVVAAVIRVNFPTAPHLRKRIQVSKSLGCIQ
jgi:hypothetical protein